MNQQINILIGDFNLISKIKLINQNPGRMSGAVLSNEYKNHIKKIRYKSRILDLIHKWQNFNSDRKSNINDILKLLDISTDDLLQDFLNNKKPLF